MITITEAVGTFPAKLAAKGGSVLVTQIINKLNSIKGYCFVRRFEDNGNLIKIVVGRPDTCYSVLLIQRRDNSALGVSKHYNASKIVDCTGKTLESAIAFATFGDKNTTIGSTVENNKLRPLLTRYFRNLPQRTIVGYPLTKSTVSNICTFLVRFYSRSKTCNSSRTLALMWADFLKRNHNLK